MLLPRCRCAVHKSNRCCRSTSGQRGRSQYHNFAWPISPNSSRSYRNSSRKHHGVYDINVLEDGEYEAYIYFANEKGKTFTITIDDETSVEGQTGPENSANWDTYIPAPAVIVSLTQGTHKLRVDFPAGGCNFKKICFKKIDK